MVRVLRRLCVVVAVVLTVLPTSVVSAEITPPPADPTPDGRTPREPRTSDGDSFFSPSTPAAATPAPGHGETGATAPAPVGVSRSRIREHVTTDQRAVALTLDDGYRPDHRILGLIESYGIHGTAFLVGAVADSDPWLVNELARLGWLVCSHTYDHMLLTGRSLETIRSEIRRGIEAVERAVGYRCPYFRAPYGSVDANVVAVTDELGVQLIGWETSISDSAPRGTDPALQLEIAKRSLREGSIVLGHFGGTNSYEVLSALLGWLSDEGYRVGSVAELIAGNVEALAPNRGTAEVNVDVPGVTDRTGALMPSRPTATRPWSLSALELSLDMLAIALVLVLLRWRFGPRRHRRRKPKTLADLLQDSVPEWERPPDIAAPVEVATPVEVVTPVPVATNGHHIAAPASVLSEGAVLLAPEPMHDAAYPAPRPQQREPEPRTSVITEGWT